MCYFGISYFKMFITVFLGYFTRVIAHRTGQIVTAQSESLTAQAEIYGSAIGQ